MLFTEMGKCMTEPNTLDEYGIVGDLSDVKIPPQIKGKLEYHSTPNTDTLDEQIQKSFLDRILLIDTEKSIMGGKSDRNAFVLLGTPQELMDELKTLFTEHSKEVDRLARIDEWQILAKKEPHFFAVCGYHARGIDKEKDDMLKANYRISSYRRDRLTQLSKRDKGEDNEI